MLKLIQLFFIINISSTIYCHHDEVIRLSRRRHDFLSDERNRALGSRLLLSKSEQKANKYLMKLKFEILQKGFVDPLNFSPARNFLLAKDNIKQCPLFRLLRRMPKGAVLHGHDVALASKDFVLYNLTYRDNVYAKIDKSNDKLLELRFSARKPGECKGCRWRNLNYLRKKYSTNLVDAWLEPQLSLNPDDAGLDVNSIWNRFMEQFGRLTPLITYKQAWKDYFYQTLLEFHEDNISYLEFRGLLNDVYDLSGNWLSGVQVAKLYVDTLTKFKKHHPGFYDAKFIYAPLRFVNDTTFKPYLSTLRQLLKQYPGFVAGFDLVGQEDIGTTLKNLSRSLLKVKSMIGLSLHAGETNWNGFHSDDNLIDAVLLGTKRIGHGYAITKHPKVCQGTLEL